MRDTFRVDKFCFLLAHILRDIDQYGTGAAGGGDVERFLDRRGKLIDVLHQKVMFDAGARDADGIHFLKRVQPDGMGRHLPADDDHAEWNPYRRWRCR